MRKYHAPLPESLVSANTFIEAQTKRISREFKCSLPRPRNKAMGFKGTDKPKWWFRLPE